LEKVHDEISPPLATPDNEGSLAENTPTKILLKRQLTNSNSNSNEIVTPKTKVLSSINENTFSGIDHINYADEASGASTSSSIKIDNNSPNIRPHKPLVRTHSNGKNRMHHFENSFDIRNNSPTPSSPLECLSSPSRSSPVIRGRTRCPPTPTHHRRIRSMSDGFSGHHPSRNILSPETVMMAADLRQETSRSEEIETNCSPVRPIARLPSIPERALVPRNVVTESDPLPNSWEARMDSIGRIFYIDHTTRTTSWQRPTTGMLPDQHRQQLDRRYQSIRRTIYSRHRSPTRESISSALTRQMQASAQFESLFRDTHPALMLICRPDFYSLLHTNPDAIEIYNNVPALKHMTNRVRRDPTLFQRYQHNRDLVNLINSFAIINMDLPSQWETKIDSTGKQFFIDHIHRKTSFMDPRLPIECPRGRRMMPAEQNCPPLIPPRTQLPRLSVGSPEVPIAYNEKVVAFLRQPNILEILKERHGTTSRSLREKINAIRVEGTTALERLGHDLQLTILLR
jgi:E3 ubiquitin-protein ligase HECW2